MAEACKECIDLNVKERTQTKVCTTPLRGLKLVMSVGGGEKEREGGRETWERHHLMEAVQSEQIGHREQAYA
jgi:hypothetical protein